MENASLVGLSRQVALRRELDVISNNVANMNTGGFKADELIYNEHILPKARDNTFKRIDQALSYVEDRATVPNFRGGELQTTGGETDVAIDGKGFFVVETPEGPRYTRNGSFRTNGTGALVTSEGHAVMSTAGAIKFAPGETNIQFGRDGTISTSEGVRGRLQVVEFDSYAGLHKDGASLFRSENTPNQGTLESRIIQGSVEKSNVQPVVELARLVDVTRAYTNISSLLQKQDELRRSTIERLADVPA